MDRSAVNHARWGGAFGPSSQTGKSAAARLSSRGPTNRGVEQKWTLARNNVDLVSLWREFAAQIVCVFNEEDRSGVTGSGGGRAAATRYFYHFVLFGLDMS